MTALLAYSVPSSVTGEDALAENQARFGVVTGEVMVLSQGAADWVEAHDGLPIEPGDHIRTNEASQAEIIPSPNAVWLLEADSDLVPERMNEQTGRFNLSNGALIGKVDTSRSGSPQHWEFNTPAAVCGIRGTEFAIEATKEKGTTLAVYEGEVEVQPAETAQGLPPAVRIAASEQAVIARGKPLQYLKVLSPEMRARADRRGDVQRRLVRIQNTWSPFTSVTRKAARVRFISPGNRLPKARQVPPKRIRRGRPRHAAP